MTTPADVRPSLPVRLLRHALVYGYYTARPHALNPIHYLRTARERHARDILQRLHPELLRHVRTMVGASDSVGCSYGDYLGLYRELLRAQPTHVLECGSGISSCVIACAVRALQRRTGSAIRFVSVEESPFFHEQVKRIFPQELADAVELVQSDRVERRYGGHLGACYRDLPEAPYDFVYIDGPTLRRAPGAPKCFSADFLNVLLRAEPGRLVRGLMDQRIGTYWVLKTLLPGATLRYDPIGQVVRIDGASRTALAPALTAGLAAGT